MIQLSNGENKRLQLINEMLKNPDLIILDNPFVGLDKSGREILKEALNKIAKDGKKIILICSEKDIPECITHIALLKEGRIIDSGEKQIVLGKNKYTPEDLTQKNKEGIKEIYTPQKADFEFAVRMQKINIQYSNKHILKNIDWEIRHGEKWCLSGPNGSGKSTLLSLITGDNPQAFANHIWLFDKKKGSGESIWDIKKKIGHVSPEIHLCFDKGSLVEDVVASGLYDTIGLFKKPSTNDLELVSKWMSYLSIEKFRGKRLFNLSLGEQRAVMLSRALVKSPLLLILDEPCQGLDEDQTNKFNHLINEICKIENVTVIYVSHYQEEIPRNIENFLHLEKGERI
jgi:molybdate transport system ATP-binding protein